MDLNGLNVLEKSSSVVPFRLLWSNCSSLESLRREEKLYIEHVDISGMSSELRGSLIQGLASSLLLPADILALVL